MKTTALVLSLLFAGLTGLCAPALAQTNPDAPEGTSIGVEPEGMLPLGDFADLTSYGVGATVYIAHGVAKQVVLTGRTGFHFFGGKETSYSTILDDGTQTIDFSLIPILGGVKYFFSEGDMRAYGGLEAGVFIQNASGEYTSSSGSSGTVEYDTQTDVALVPQVGMQFRSGEAMRIDTRVNFSNIFTEGSSTNWITFGIGFEWELN